MKILVIGGGSIGRRHASNLLHMSVDVAVFDLDASRTSDFAQENGTPLFDSFEDALSWGADGAIVATPHVSHLSVARQVIEAGIDVLIEKPISHTLDGVSDLLSFAQDQQRHIYVACNMRFHPAIRALRDKLPALGSVHHVYAYFGEWLETMRPGIDYRSVYAAHKKQGGGLVLDCIHEIDYLSWFFGAMTSVSCSLAKRSALEIDVEDYAALHIEHDSGVRCELHFDYLQRLKRRGCEIIGSAGTLLWSNEGKKTEKCTVRYYDASTDEITTLLDVTNLDANQMYIGMMQAFIESLKKPGSQPDLLTGDMAQHSLAVCMSAYDSAALKQVKELS